MKAIAGKLVLIMSEVGNVPKDKKNTFHGYRYASADAVLAKVQDACVKHKVAAYSEMQTVNRSESETKGGKKEWVITVSCKLHIIDAETGEEVVQVSEGSGSDAGDKAVMKAETAAVKYAWMHALQISTGDDPEADASTDERVEGERKVTAKPAESAIDVARTKIKNSTSVEDLGAIWHSLSKAVQSAVVADKDARKAELTKAA